MSRIGPHTMLGKGGKIVQPMSESVILSTVAEDLRTALDEPQDYDKHVKRALTLVMRLLTQVGQGYHRNPRAFSSEIRAGRLVGKIGDDVEEVRYRHVDDGEYYKHDFNGEAEVFAVERNGKRELLIVHRRGLPLWEDFD